MGPLILDNLGRVVWFHPQPLGATDFRVQRYRGRPVLTWWEGRSKFGVGRGHYFIYDESYRRIAVVRAGNGLAGDEHEFTLTPRGTALITFYDRRGRVLDSGFQELDVASGHVLFQWHAAGHIALSESYAKRRGRLPFDYFHINSVDLGPDGNFLISARNTHAIYDIDCRTGAVRWRLGGKRSDFAMGRGTRFAWQHDARWRSRSTISLFDDGAAPPVEKQSRALLLHVDLHARKVTLVHAYEHPGHLLAGSQGNMQVLPDGHVFVGWGQEPWFTEFDPDGRVLFDGRFGSKGADSYRAYRLVWSGHPRNKPAVAVSRSGGSVTVYVSWNGATDVARWQVLGSTADGPLTPLASATRSGFETKIRIKTDARRFAVRALAANGAAAGTSATVSAGSG